MNYWADVLNHALMFGMLAVALNLLIGYAGYLSLAHAAFFGIGAYVAALSAIHWHLSFTLSTVLAILAAGAVGAAIAFPAVRISGEYIILLTLAFLQVISQLEVAWIPVTGGATGLFPIPPASLFGFAFATPLSYVPLLLACTTLALGVCLITARSPFGRVLRGLREDARATRALGKNIITASVVVFAITAGIAGAVGSLWAHYFNFITPDSFTLSQTIFIAAIVVLGGTGSLAGSVLGAVVLVFLSQLLTRLNIADNNAAAIQQVVYGAALVLFMRFRPGGLLGTPDGSSRARTSLPWRRRAVVLAEPALAAAGMSASAVMPVSQLPAAADPVPPEPGGDPPAAPSGAGPVAGLASPAAAPPGVEVAVGVYALQGAGISKSYSGLRALDGVDIALPKGQITILVGANGAGKTTLFNVLTGDTAPDEGAVRLWGEPITGLRSNRVVARGMARSFQDVRLFARMSALDNVVLGCQGNAGESLWRTFLRPTQVRRSERACRDRAMECLQAVGLTAQAPRPAADLSYGEQKLLAIARLLATGCKVLLLDEPSSGVDDQWVSRILDLITELTAAGITICIVEHSIEVVSRLPGHAYFLSAGRIVAEGTIHELMAQPELVDAYFGG